MSDRPRTIAIGADCDALSVWIRENGIDPLRVISAGVLYVEGIQWVGIPPPRTGTTAVNLRTPDSLPEEIPGWLYFEPFCAWTTDLTAVQFDQ